MTPPIHYPAPTGCPDYWWSAAWSYTDIPKGTKGATVSMNVNFLEGAMTDMEAEARTIRRGGSIVVVDVDVLNDKGGKIAKGMVTYKLSRPKL